MGSFGKVYRYEYGRQKRAVKIKVRKAGQEMADDLDFTSEVNALCRLADSPHPNVMVGFQLTLFDTWVRTGVAAVEMAFYPCSGDQVGPIPGDYQLKTVRYAAVIREIASGLNHLHRHNIIHKDLKPQNILIGSDGHCVIADYGSSVDTQDNKLSYTQSGQILEYGNSIVTTGFVAPEILFVGNGGFATYDSKVDVWSLGMTIYSLITGWMAPAQYISHAVLGLDGSNRMRSEMEKRGCPQPVQALVLTMCQINPEHRMNCLDIITVADMLLKHEDKDPAKLEAPFVVEYVAQEEGDDGQEYNPLWNLTPPNPAASTGIMEFGRLLKKYRPRL
ncbi:kinase-like domain-containing protein [Favolaschia claudopus]|uniref:Kinase-like domain-containing protein n=1 Tax=Favolaschia claudopus TaxID=2862362 RepID=A0AAW0DY58_9AGAR